MSSKFSNSTAVPLANESTTTMQQDSTSYSVQYTELSRNEQDMLVNVTREYPFDYATIMFGYIMPFVLILTLITNTLVVMVLAQRHMRTPTNIVLFTMAIVDLMTLLSPSPWYFYIYTLGYHDQFLYPPIACYAHHIMTDVIPVFFHTSSIWLALLLASQRYIYVCHPTLASTWCTVPRVKKAIIILLVIAFLHQLTRFFDNTFVSVSIQYNQGYHLACKNEISDWVHKLDVAIYYTTYFTFRILFVFIIPCVALITLNCLLFRALKRVENKRTELLRTKFKLIGGNDCSVGGIDVKQSSFIRNNGRHANTEPSRKLLPDTVTRKCFIAGGKRTQSVAKTNDIDKRKKFFITSFQMKRRNYSKTCITNRSQNNLIKVSSPINQTSVTKLSSSLLEDQLTNNSNGDCNRKEKSDARRSDESNDSCSVTTTHSKYNGEDRQFKLKFSRSNRFENNESRSVEDEDINYVKDEELICTECATCERNVELGCQHCSAASNDGTTGDRNGNFYQAVSQCSSLMGGVTNTTTNEDASSCIVTQNASSSMFVIHDGNLEAIEASSMREDDIADLDIDQENLSLENNASQLKENAKSAGSNATKITKSGSIDSRLVCDFMLTTPRSVSFNRLRLSNKLKRECRECCRAKSCRPVPSSRRFISSGISVREIGKGKHMECVASCSNSDPSINCINRSNGLSKKDTKCALNTDERHLNSTLPMSQSDYGNNEVSEENKRLNADIFASRNPIAATTTTTTTITTTTTTTTTTLYSTKTNSVGSLPQAQNQGLIKRHEQESQKSTLQTYMKNLSSASNRGSRATLMGSPNLPNLSGSNNMAATTSASIRTMDSNRTTLMLIVVVTVFLMVEVPVAIVTILHVVLNTFDVFKDVEFGSSLNYIKLFTNFFIMISYSVNFTIYCSMSKKFRETFRDLFLCGKRAKRKRVNRQLYRKQQQQHSQYNQHQFKNYDTQLMQNNNATLGCETMHNDFTQQAFSSSNNNYNNNNNNNSNASMMLYSPYRRANNQQQECEL